MRSTPGDIPVWDVFTCYSSHMFAGCYVCTSYVCIIPNSCVFNNHIYYQKAVIKATNTKKKGGKEIPATEDSTELRTSLIMLMLMLIIIIIISHLGITWSPRLCSQGDYETEGRGREALSGMKRRQRQNFVYTPEQPQPCAATFSLCHAESQRV